MGFGLLPPKLLPWYCWWFRNPAITTWDVKKHKKPVNTWVNYQPQLVISEPSAVPIGLTAMPWLCKFRCIIGKWMISSWWFQIYLLFSSLPGEMVQFEEHLFQMAWFKYQPVLRFYFESNPEQPGLVVEKSNNSPKKDGIVQKLCIQDPGLLRNCIVGKPETTWELPINDLRILLPIVLRRRRPWPRTDERGDEQVVCLPKNPYPFPRIIGLRVAIPSEKSRILGVIISVILSFRDIPGFLGFFLKSNKHKIHK